MQIEVTTDANVEGTQELIGRVKREVSGALSRFGDRLTRVEVHLADESRGRSTASDMRCTTEARPAGQPPIAVTHHASSPDEAFRGAVQKLENRLDRHFERLDDHKGGATIRTGEQD